MKAIHLEEETLQLQNRCCLVAYFLAVERLKTKNQPLKMEFVCVYGMGPRNGKRKLRIIQLMKMLQNVYRDGAVCMVLHQVGAAPDSKPRRGPPSTTEGDLGDPA